MTIRRMLAGMMLALLSVLVLVNPGEAQWQVCDHCVPIGNGGGTGFAQASPGAAGRLLQSTGTTSDPAFATTLTGNYTLAPPSGTPLTITPAAGLNQGLVITQTGTGAPPSGVFGTYNSITINDGWDVSAVSADTAVGFLVQHTAVGASVKGSRNAILAYLLVGADSAVSAANRDFVGVASQVNSSAVMPVTATAASLFGYGASVILGVGASGFNLISGAEIQVGSLSAGATNYIHGWNVVYGGTQQATILSAAYGVGANSGTVGWQRGLLFSDFNGGAPFTTTATLIATSGARTVTNGVSFTSYTFTGNAWESPGASISGAGLITGAAGAFNGAVTISSAGAFTALAMTNATVSGVVTPSVFATNSLAVGTISAHPLTFITQNALRATLSTAGSWTWAAYGAGIIHSSSGGVLTSSAIVTADITDANITYAKIQNVAALSVFGRSTGTAGVGADITGTANQFLGVNSAGTALAFQTMSGDATLSSGALTIANDAVTNAKLANMANSTIKCRTTAGTGDPEDCTAANLKAILGYPTASIDNTVPRFDGTSGNLQTSSLVINDSGQLLVMGATTVRATITIDGDFWVGSPGNNVGGVFTPATSVGITLQVYDYTVTGVKPLLIQTANGGVNVGAGTDPGATTFKVSWSTASTTTATGSLINAGGFGNAGAGYFGAEVVTGAVAVGSLPACNAGRKAARHFVTDANAAFTAGIGAVVAAGGANNVPVTCDGTNWRIGANDNIPAHLMRKFA